MDTPHTRPARRPRRATAAVTKLAAALIVFTAAGLDRPARAQADGQVLAVVDGRAITAAELDASIVSQLLPLQQ